VYAKPSDVPKGIELADASRLMPRSKATAHAETGSFALAADFFRYEVQAAELGVYVDCDCYCVEPLEETEYLMGWESQSQLCPAVLRLPKHSPLLADLRTIGSVRAFIPPWLPRRRRRKLMLRAAIGMPVPLAKMPWGTAGPIALTYYAQKHGLADRALAPDILYGLAPGHAGLLLEPGLSIHHFATPRTRVIHLWNEYSRRSNRTPHPNSPLAKIIEEGMRIN